MISNPPQGKPAILRCSITMEEADFIFNSLPQSGLIDTFTRSELGEFNVSLLTDSLTRTEAVFLGNPLSESLTRTESMSFVNI